MRRLIAETQGALGRITRNRVLRAMAAIALVLLFAVRVARPGGGGALALLSAFNEVVMVFLWLMTAVAVYVVLAPDIDEGFEALGPRGNSEPVTFALGRVLGIVTGLLAAGIAAWLVIGLLTALSFAVAEALHLLATVANLLPFLVVDLIGTCIAGRILAPLLAYGLTALGGDAFYDRWAMADGFITDNFLVTAERRVAWLLPGRLVTPLTGDMLKDAARRVNTLPERAGTRVFGLDVIRVSDLGDVLHQVVYVAVLLALLCLACRRLAARAERRVPLTPALPPAAPRADPRVG